MAKQVAKKETLKKKEITVESLRNKVIDLQNDLMEISKTAVYPARFQKAKRDLDLILRNQLR